MRGDQLPEPYYVAASPALLARQPAEMGPGPKAMPGWDITYGHLEARLAAMKAWRLSWWSHHSEIARYELPRRYHSFVTPNTYDRGLRRDWNIVDSTATLDGETCAGGMMACICPPERPWLTLGPGIPGLELDRAGQMYFDDYTERLRFIQAETNYYDSFAQNMEDTVFFGTGVVIDYEDKDDIFTCANPCAGEYLLAAGANFANQSLYTEERRTVSQLVEMFGLANCPDDVRFQWQQKGGALETEHLVGHAIEPNYALPDGKGGEVGRLPGNFTWREIYWLIGKQGTGPLSKAGFFEKPHAAAPWHTVSNDPYGRGPGTTALGDTIQLQLESRQKAEALEKVIKPPMGADPQLKGEPNSTRPGAITYYDTSTGKKGFHPLFEIRPDIGAITADIVDIRERIGRAFHANLFRMIEELANTKRDVSATEVDALREERLLRLGPVIGRIYKRGLRPRIERQLAIMERRGLAPRKPASLQNVPTQIEFISMLTMAQRASATSSIERSFAFVQSLNPQLFPKARHVLDDEEGVREFAQLRGLPSRIVRSARDTRDLAEQDQRQQMAAQLANTGLAAVQGAKTLSEASLGGGKNALGALVGQG